MKQRALNMTDEDYQSACENAVKLNKSFNQYMNDLHKEVVIKNEKEELKEALKEVVSQLKDRGGFEVLVRPIEKLLKK